MRWATVVVVAAFAGGGALAAARWRSPAPVALPALSSLQPAGELPVWFGDATAPPVAITGRVHADHLPLTVRLALAEPDPGWRGVEVVTGLDGAFDLGPQRRGRYRVVAYDDRTWSREVEVDTLGAAAPVTVDVFAYSCVRSAGRIRRSSDDAPVVGARVSFGGRAIAVTGRGGRVSFCGPAEGVVRLDGAGIAATRWGAFLHDLSVSVEPAVTRHGRVLDESGAPLAGVGVQPSAPRVVSDLPSSDPPLVATTDAAGAFTFADLDEDAMEFVIHRPGGAVTSAEYVADPADAELVLRASAVVGAAALPDREPLDHGAWIRGRVMRGGQPVPDAIVIAAAGEVCDLPETRSDAHGAFAIRARAFRSERWPVELMASVPGLAIDGGLDLAVTPGQAIEDLDLPIGRGRVVRGTVVDERGAPVAGVTVGGSDTRDVVASDRAGRFSFVVHRVGTFRLAAWRGSDALSPAAGRLFPRVTIDVLDGAIEDVRLVVAARPRAGARAEGDEGRVPSVAASPGPATASLVVRCAGVTPSHGGIVVDLDGRGVYHLACDERRAELEPGAITVFARHGDGRNAFATAELVAGRETEVVLTLAPVRAVTVRPVDLTTRQPIVGGACCRATYVGFAERDDFACGPDEVSPQTAFLADRPVILRCDAALYRDDGRAVMVGDVAPGQVLDAWMVPIDIDAIDVGAELAADRDGARITAVADEVAAAGVVPGDVLVEVDGVPLAGRALDTIVEFAVRLPRGGQVAWTVRRGATTRTVRITAPR